MLVFCSGPARVLGELGYLQRLRYLVQVVLPTAVTADLPQGLAQDLSARHGIFVTGPAREWLDQARPAKLQPPDTEALALCLEGLGPMVADDPQPQRAAARHAIPVINTFGVLVELRGVGMMARPLREDLVRLGQLGLALPADLSQALDGGERRLWRALQAAAGEVAWTPPTEIEAGG